MCLVQVGNGIELEAIGLQFEPYRWCPCGVTWDSSRTVVVIKLLLTSALKYRERSSPCRGNTNKRIQNPLFNRAHTTSSASTLTGSVPRKMARGTKEFQHLAGFKPGPMLGIYEIFMNCYTTC